MSGLPFKKLRVLLAFIFEFQSLSFWTEASNTEPFIRIPSHLGTIEKVWHGHSRKTIYLIRDLHAHEEAQRKEISILQWLRKKTKLNWLLLEGAEGFLNTAFLRTLSSDPVFQKKLMDEFLVSGELTAAEYLAVMEPHLWNVTGIEKSSLYWMNVEAFQKTRGIDDAVIEKIFKKAEKRVLRTFQKNAPLRLLHFYRMKKNLDQNKIGLKKYCEVLLKIAMSLGLNKENFPQLLVTERLSHLEPILKDGAIAKEFEISLETKIKNLSSFETKKWIQIILSHRIGKISHTEYLSQIHPLFNADEEKYFAPYFEALRLQETLNLAQLQEEVDQLEKAVETNLLWSSDLYQLKIILEQLEMLKKICFLQLSPQEYKQTQNWNFKKILQEISLWKDQRFLSSANQKILNVRLKNAFKFYAAAKTRDKILSENILEFIQKKNLNQAAVIIGGFHSGAIAKKLSQDGINVIVITPRLKTIADESKYLKIMSGKETFLDMLLGNKVLDAEIKIQLHPQSMPLKIAQELMPPLRLAQAHTALRRALEEKALFLSFLNFLYFEAKGPSFLKEVERFKEELKISYLRNLNEELEQNEIPAAERSALIENATVHLNQFFETLRIQNIEKKGSSIKIQARFDEKIFETEIFTSSSIEIPESLKESLETAELKEGVKWSLKLDGVKDPHWLEIKNLLGENHPLEKDLMQKVWSQESIALETLKKDNPDLFKIRNQTIPETDDRIPVILLEEKDATKTYRILSGENTLWRLAREGNIHYVTGWIGKIDDPDTLIREYQAWEKSKAFFVGTFESVLKSKMEIFFDLLRKTQSIPTSDEALFDKLRRTVLSNLPPEVQEAMIASLEKTLTSPNWVSDWKDLEHRSQGYNTHSVRTAIKEAQPFAKNDGKIYWDSPRRLIHSHSSIIQTMAWDIMAPSFLKPLALHYLRSEKVLDQEEAIRVLGILKIGKEVLIPLLSETREFRLIEATKEALAKFGDEILPDLQEIWDESKPQLIQKIADILIKIKSVSSLEMLADLTFKLSDESRASLLEFFKRSELQKIIVSPLWKIYRDNFSSRQKEDLLSILEIIPLNETFGPILYLANWAKGPIKEKAKKTLNDTPHLASLLQKRDPSAWKETTRYLKRIKKLEYLGNVISSINQASESTRDELRKSLKETGVRQSFRPLISLLFSKNSETAKTAALTLDLLQVREKIPRDLLSPSHLRSLSTHLKSLQDLIPHVPLTYQDFLEVKTFVAQSDGKHFKKALERLDQLKSYMESEEAFESLVKGLGIEILLRIENIEQQVELRINPELTLEFHPGTLQQLKDHLRLKAEKKTILFNSFRWKPTLEGEVQNLRERFLAFRRFNQANFQLIQQFREGDWTKEGFKMSKNKVFQIFDETLKYYEELFPNDEEIPKIRTKASQIHKEAMDKDQLMDLGPYRALEDISTLHGLLRYIHQKGVDQMFDVVKVRIKDSQKVSSVSTFMINPAGKVLERVHHPVLIISQKDFGPKKGYPEPLKFFMRNILHMIDPQLPSPYIQVIIDENELFAYFGMGRHTAELFANFTHPDQGGMMQLRWNEGAEGGGEGWEDAGEYVAPLRLYIIDKILNNLGVNSTSDAWQLRARYDKESGARAIADIMRVTGSTLRTSAGFKDVDVALGRAARKKKDMKAYLDELAEYMNRMGKVEFYKAAIRDVPMAPKVQTMEKYENELRAVLNNILIDLNLGPMPEVESRPFGQVAINRYFNKRISEGLRDRILVLSSNGQVQKDPTLKEIRQVPEMARQLAPEGELENLLRTASLIQTLSPILKFTSIGTINGYVVQRAQMELLEKVLTFIVLRNHQGEILMGFAASGTELYSRQLKEKIVNNLIRSPETLFKILRKSGFPISESSHRISKEDQQRGIKDLERIRSHPLPILGKLYPGHATPGIGISAGIAIGKVKLDQKDIAPDTLHDCVWIVPFALPDHISKIRKSRATIMTGGSPLTHAGMLIREAHRPGVIMDARWVYDGTSPIEIHVPFETYDRVFEQAGDFQITRRQNINKRDAALQDGDIVLVNGAGEIYIFPPDLQSKASATLELIEKIKSQKETASLYQICRYLNENQSQDLVQLATFDLFLNSPQLTSYEKRELLRIFKLNLTDELRSFVQQYLNDYLIAQRHKVTNTLHDIKVRIPEVRQPIELEYLLSRAMNTVEDFQNIQMMIGQSARVYRSSLSEIVDLAKSQVDVLKKEVSLLSIAGPEWLLNDRAVEKAKKLGAIVDSMYANAKSWFKKWLDHQREKLKGEIVYPIGLGVEKALAFMVDRIGAKAAKLAEISGLVPVPPGFVIDVDAYNQFLEKNNLVSQIQAIVSSGLSNAEKSKQIQNLIYSAPIPKDLEEKFLQEFRDLKAESVAVRSSSTAEDMDTASFAGQMETTLNVQGEEAFLTAVKRSWASLWTQRAIEYRQDYDIPLEVGQAVFVQTMIDSQVSGVISTMNVLTNDWSEMVVNSGWGLGSGPIEGKTNSDQFILDMKIGRLKQEFIAKKTAEYTKESGDNAVPISSNRVFAKTLTPDQLSTLHRYAKKLEDYYGFPLDIEFAIDRNREIHIVQVRPITTVDIRKDVNLTDLSSLHRKVLDNFADNLWGEFQSLVENAANGLDSLRTLQNLSKRQSYANPNYKGYMYILVNVLQKWLKEYGTSKDIEALTPDIYVIADALKQKPYETWPPEKLESDFPNEFKKMETYLKPFIDQKSFKGVEKISELKGAQEPLPTDKSALSQYEELSMETIEEASFVNDALNILNSGTSLVLEGEYAWVRDHFYLIAEQLHFDGKQERIDRIFVSPSSLKRAPKIFRRLYTEEPLIQLSEILPLGFNNGYLIRLANLKDAPEIRKLNNEMAQKFGEPERQLEYFQKLLRDNPLSLIAIDKAGRIKGTLFLGLIRMDGLDNIPQNYQDMIQAHQDSEDINTIVDFWILGMPELIPFSKYLASKWGLEHLIAYSRPSRAGTLLYELAKADQSDLDFNELMNILVRKINVKDRLIAYLDRLNARKLLGIQVDYHTDEGLDHFMSLYLVKHLLLASRNPVDEAVSNRSPFLKWMTKHQDDLSGEFAWFSFDKVWDYLHNDELNFDSEVDLFQFASKMKPIIQKFLRETDRWTLESVLWRLHFKAEMQAIFPASRSDGTYQDLWSNVIMVYPIRPNYISAPPVKTESLKIPVGQSVLERAA